MGRFRTRMDGNEVPFPRLFAFSPRINTICADETVTRNFMDRNRLALGGRLFGFYFLAWATSGGSAAIHDPKRQAPAG